MRIVFVQAGLAAGGAEKIINLLAKHRADQGDDVHVLAFTAENGGSYFPYPDTIQVETLEPDTGSGRRGMLLILRRICWLRRRFSDIKPELIVSFLTKTNVAVLLASRGQSIPVVISERNNPGQQDAHPLWRPASLLLAWAAEGIVMQTDEARNFLPAGLQTRARVIPNPCILPSAMQMPKRDGQRIIAVGRLERQKGFDLLLAAFAKMSSNAPQATLTIFGEGRERAALVNQAEALGISEKINLPGVTNRPGAWLAVGDVFVLSSRFEGFPNVLVEALAGGYATIAFNCPWGPATIVDDEKTGVLVPPEDVDKLAEALRRVCIDADFRSALQLAAPNAVCRYSPVDVLAQWDAVIAGSLQ